MRKRSKRSIDASTVWIWGTKRLYVIVLSILFFSVFIVNDVLSTELPMPPEGKVPSVDAIETERPVSLGFQPAVDGPALRPNHPPIDQIPPMPMPEPPEITEQPVSGANGGVTLHNAATKETMTIPVDMTRLSGKLSGQGDGYNGADGGGNAEQNGTNLSLGAFNNMRQITNTGSSPWRMNAKLVMHFVDQGGNDRWFGCSGSMRDAGVVLTAGHCVYAREPDGIKIFDWADEIWVYPGWDGVGWTNSTTINPYGFGHSSYFLAGSDWINNGNVNRDLGLVGFERAVGQLTGWFGWTWGGSCSWHKDRTYHNASYPRESCSSTLHTGRDMYYWYGRFDSCSGNQIRINTTGGCFNAGWGGMSGSGAYWIENDYRRVHAVSSTSDRSTWARYTRQWETFVNDTDNSFIPNVRGNTFDLQPLDVNVGPSSIRAGDRTTLLNHLATNPTNGSDNDTYTFGVYLSANDNLSTSDTLLSTQFYTRNFGAMNSVRINMAQVTIPPDTPAGNYWLGIVYDNATDNDSTDNDTDGWDAGSIQVLPRSCSSPSVISASDGAFASSVQVTWNSSATCDYYYRVYRNTSSNSSGAIPVSNWQASRTFNDTSAIPGQIYYYWVRSATSRSGMYASSFSGYNAGWRELPLSNDTPVAYSMIPNNFSFSVRNYDWCGVAINPSTDHDIKVDNNADFSSPYESSTAYGTTRDFVVANGHSWGSATHYAQVSYGSSSLYTIEAEWEARDLWGVNPITEVIKSGEIIDMYEVSLTGGEQYRLDLEVTSGNADLAIFVFKPSRSSGSRLDYDWSTNSSGSGGDENLSFIADSTGDYGIAVMNENNGSANYTISLTTADSGDINDDGVIDVTDLQLLINCLVGSGSCARCDLNDDGAYNIFDLQLLINKILAS